MSSKGYTPDIVFINGIMPRSGTHFLANLLCHHPACDRGVIPEDGLIERAALLKKYVERNYQRWQIEGGLPDIDAKNLLYQSIGEGLIDFLRKTRVAVNQKDSLPQDDEAKYLITKSPQTANLNEFGKLFPNGRLLIIVRDGRDLVESIHTSFSYKVEHAIRDWAEAAQRIIAFENSVQAPGVKYLIVKYEDLHSNTSLEMQKIIAFLDLDEQQYDFESALQIPVVGSSVFKRGQGDVHWNPVAKTNEFKPLARSSNWTRKQHERFNWLAKKELSYFGYHPKKFSGYSLYFRALNCLLDIKYKLELRMQK